MQSIEGFEPRLFKKSRSLFDFIIDKDDTLGQLEDRENISFFLRLRVVFHFQLKDFGRNEFDGPLLDHRDYPDDRFRLKRNS